jgi:hypothetical protein
VIVNFFLKTARDIGLMVRGDKQSPGIGPKLKQADFEFTFSGLTVAFDVKVVSPLSECYDTKNLVSRVHPVSFGDDDEWFWDFSPPRDDGAASHTARFVKIRNYVPDWTPSEGAYEPMDKKKETVPEERRLLKNVKIEDPARGQIALIPLVFEIGGRVAPEVEVLIKDLVETTVESDQRGGPTAYSRVHQAITTSLSNKLMRAAARNILRNRDALSYGGGERLCIRRPDVGLDEPILNTPTNWIPFGAPLFSSSATIIQTARPAPPPAKVTTFKRGQMKVHMQTVPELGAQGTLVPSVTSVQNDPGVAGPLTSFQSSSSTSSSFSLFTTPPSIGPT